MERPAHARAAARGKGQVREDVRGVRLLRLRAHVRINAERRAVTHDGHRDRDRGGEQSVRRRRLGDRVYAPEEEILRRGDRPGSASDQEREEQREGEERAGAREDRAAGRDGREGGGGDSPGRVERRGEIERVSVRQSRREKNRPGEGAGRRVRASLRHRAPGREQGHGQPVRELGREHGGRETEGHATDRDRRASGRPEDRLHRRRGARRGRSQTLPPRRGEVSIRPRAAVRSPRGRRKGEVR
mmetsp:Transcript_11010/g.39838  ORF Transcript_11010/g.39838 Transcript_11010/m.39838 type:complete len:244 (+) Transcript_11010:375-1106(+)